MRPTVHTYEWRVSECEPPHRLGFEATSGTMRPAGTIVFRPEGEATRVDFEMALNPRGWMKLLAPIIERQVQKRNTEHLALFKQRLEADTS